LGYGIALHSLPARRTDTPHEMGLQYQDLVLLEHFQIDWNRFAIQSA